MKILIVTGGKIKDDFVRQYLKGHSFDHIIAADSGLSHCHRLGISPTEILGDFDSLRESELLEYYKKKGVPVREFPMRKDFTDTHLAFFHAKSLNPKKVVVLGATGTRYDHAMANIGLLAHMVDADIECQIIDSHNCMEMLHGKTEKIYQKTEEKTYFSLLACSPEVTGITLEGFSYPLKEATMHAFDSLGISNEIVEEEGKLQMESGYLLVVRARD